MNASWEQVLRALAQLNESVNRLADEVHRCLERLDRDDAGR